MTNAELFKLTRAKGLPLPGGVISVRHFGAAKIDKVKLATAMSPLYPPDAIRVLIQHFCELKPHVWTGMTFSGFSEDAAEFWLAGQGCGIEIELLKPGFHRDDYEKMVTSS